MVLFTKLLKLLQCLDLLSRYQNVANESETVCVSVLDMCWTSNELNLSECECSLSACYDFV